VFDKDVFERLKTFIEQNLVSEEEAREKDSSDHLRFPSTPGWRGIGRHKDSPLGPLKDLQGIGDQIRSFITEHVAKEPFTVLLDKLRKDKGMEPSELYEKAMVDRWLYSKMMNKRDYHPTKNRAISLGLALEANEDELSNLLASAGYALSPASKFDLVILFCVQNKIYNIMQVNECLDNVELPLLQEMR
jgi:hypothetical protein